MEPKGSNDQRNYQTTLGYRYRVTGSRFRVPGSVVCFSRLPGFAFGYAVANRRLATNKKGRPERDFSTVSLDLCIDWLPEPQAAAMPALPAAGLTRLSDTVTGAGVTRTMLSIPNRPGSTPNAA